MLSHHKRTLILIFSSIFCSTISLEIMGQGNSAPSPLSITSITPTGINVPAGRQIVFHFNRAVVPLGAMERTASEVFVTSEPEIVCQWRWLNTNSLACQLDQKNALKPATRYRLRMSPGIRAEDGGQLAETVEHEFVTELPKVTYAWVSNWKSPSQPVINLNFNQPVGKASLTKQLYVVVGTNETLGIKSQELNEPRFVVEKTPYDNQDAIPLGSDEARSRWLVYPQTALPEAQSLALKIRPGLASSAGPELGRENRELLTFYTFPEFRFLGIRCRTLSGDNVLLESSENSEQKCLHKYRRKDLPGKI